MKDAHKWLWSLILPYKWRAFLGALLVAMTILSNVGLLALSSVLLAKAALLPPLLTLMTLITSVRFFGTIRAVWRYGERLYNHNIAFQILTDIRVRLYNCLEKKVPEKLSHYTEGKLYIKLMKDVEVLQFFYLRVVSVPLGTAIVIILSSFILYLFSPRAGILLLSVLILVTILGTFIWNKSARMHEQTVRNHREALAATFTDIIHGIVELKTINYLDSWKRYIFEKIESDIAAKSILIKREQKVTSVMIFISHFTAIAVLVVSWPIFEHKELSGIYFAMLALIVMASFETIQQMSQVMSELWASIVSAEEMYPIFENIGKKTLAKTENILKDYKLELDNISFNYHSHKLTLIFDISMKIDINQHVAFIGKSGSGKTSIAKLILKLWNPDSGSIHIGGIDYKVLSDDQIRENISLLEQNPAFFRTSVRENLLIAKPSATEDELWDVLKSVNLIEKFSHEVEGLDTQIGENGVNLSGGERQRLGLARILLKNTPIVILDEPLQNLDGITSNLLNDLLYKWKNKKTVIIITHSLKNLPDMDFIYLFKDGTINAAGNHCDLLENSPYYQQLWNLVQEQF